MTSAADTSAQVYTPPAGTLPSLWWVDEQGKVVIRPHPGQARALRSTRRFVWMLAGTQGGKTSLQPIWLYYEMQKRGPGDYLAVTANFPLLERKLLPEFRRWFEHTHHLCEWRYTARMFLFSREKLAFHFGDKRFLDADTRIIVGSAVNAQSLESTTALAATLDEAGQDDYTLESWEAVQRRLSIPHGRVLAGTTLYNLGWLKQQVYDPWRAGSQDHDVIQFPSTLNPAFPQDEYERMRATMAPWRFAMFYRGQYERPAGLVYSDYLDISRELGGHLISPFALPSEWPRHVGVDFGPIHTSTVWLAHDPQANVYYAYHETLGTEPQSVAEHTTAAVRFAQGTNVRTWHGGSASEDQQRDDWSRRGVPVLPPLVHDVEAGIDRVVALLRGFRLYVFDTMTGLRDELGSYSREVNEYGETTARIKNKERYHRLDALRYVGQALGVLTMRDLPATVPFLDKEAPRSRSTPSDAQRVAQRWMTQRSKERAQRWKEAGWVG